MEKRIMNFPSRFQLLVISSIFLFTLGMISLQGNAWAYYGYGYGGLYGGLYGGGLYGFGNYAGSGSTLGSVYYSGLGGLYGGAYGGLYGRGLYGLGGIYGGGLYGSLYGGGLYGLYGGLYGGGLYGSSLYGLGGLYSGLGGLYGLSGLGGLRYGLAEQAGTWEGLWYSSIASGPISINIIQDPVLTSNVYGYVQLLGNAVLPVQVEVTGTVLNNQVFLNGSYSGAGGAVILDIVANLVSSTEMQGNYTLGKSGALVLETGSFTASLMAPVI